MTQIGYFGSYSHNPFTDKTTYYITTIKINDTPQISSWDIGNYRSVFDEQFCTFKSENYEVLSMETLDGEPVDFTKYIDFQNRCIETSSEDSFVFSKQQVINSFISEIVYNYAFSSGNEVPYMNSIKNYSGKFNSYCADGSVESTFELKNGIPIGSITYYNREKTRYIINLNSQGKAHGQVIYFNDRDTNIHFIENYINGKMNGDPVYHTYVTGYVGYRNEKGMLGIQTIEAYDLYSNYEDDYSKMLHTEKYRIVKMEEFDNFPESKQIDLSEMYGETHKIRTNYTGFVLSRERVKDMYIIELIQKLRNNIAKVDDFPFLKVLSGKFTSYSSSYKDNGTKEADIVIMNGVVTKYIRYYKSGNISDEYSLNENYKTHGAVIVYKDNTDEPNIKIKTVGSFVNGNCINIIDFDTPSNKRSKTNED